MTGVNISCMNIITDSINLQVENKYAIMQNSRYEANSSGKIYSKVQTKDSVMHAKPDKFIWKYGSILLIMTVSDHADHMSTRYFCDDLQMEK